MSTLFHDYIAPSFTTPNPPRGHEQNVHKTCCPTSLFAQIDRIMRLTTIAALMAIVPALVLTNPLPEPDANVNNVSHALGSIYWIIQSFLD